MSKQISECIAPRGSFTSDDQKNSSYPFAFDRNCPYGVTDKEIIDKDNIKVCQPHLPPFQNQYTIHSHFQDLFLKPDCPSCIQANNDSTSNKASNLNNNPQCLQTDCLYVDPMATQFSSIPLPVCFGNNTDYILPTATNTSLNSNNDKMSGLYAINSLLYGDNGKDTFTNTVAIALFWIVCIYIVLMLIKYLSKPF